MKKTLFTFISKYLYFSCLVLIFAGCKTKKYEFVKDLPQKKPYSVYEEELEKIRLKDDSLRAIAVGKFTEPTSPRLTSEQIRLKEIYSVTLQVSPEEIKNYKLYEFIDKWMNTPYKPGTLIPGKGATNSYLIQSLYSEVFKITLPKDPIGMYKSNFFDLFVGRPYLQEGDIIFFRYELNKPIGDVAVYLQNHKIFMCTQNKGVGIYDFNTNFFDKIYLVSGRPIIPKK